MESMSRFFASILLLSFLNVGLASAQTDVSGPRSVGSDSIQVTLKKVQLEIVDSETNIKEGLTPRLKPTGGTEAQIWFTLGFMLESCHIREVERVGSDHPSLGSTVHDITIRCHYKASEFRSALRDMLK